MRKPIPLEMTTFDLSDLSQEERTEFYREAIRRAHAARSDAVRALLRTIAKRFRRQPLLARAAASSAVILAVVISLGMILSA
jgi:hypothetical protein